MNAKKIISTAFYELLQKYEIEEISVNRIVQAAEVSKPTFYRYYRDKYDLLNQMFDVISSRCAKRSKRLPGVRQCFGFLTISSAT